MIPPEFPPNEAGRQAALERYAILDSLPERAYDDITALMAQVCRVPISLVGLLDRDRNWLKSRHGVALTESPRELSFCGHAIASGQEVFTIEDARLDPRFADNPLVTEHGAIGYAGAPLVDADGYALGTLCVFNPAPLVLDDGQLEALRAMARQVMYLLERHLRERRLEATGAELAERNAELARFVGAVSHDLKASATNIAELAGILRSDAHDALDAESRQYLEHLDHCSVAMRRYIDRLLAGYAAEGHAGDPARDGLEDVPLAELFAEIERLTVRDAGVRLTLPRTDATIRTRAGGLQQVLLNLVGNAVKYAVGESPSVVVDFAETDAAWTFRVVDDGPGIDADRQEEIFELFATAGHLDRGGRAGTGIGLATVRAVVERLGGTIELDSAPGRGSAFTVSLPRPDADSPPERRAA